MRLGAIAPYSAQSASTAETLSMAQAAEDAGLDSFWTFDIVGRNGWNPDPLITLAAVAVSTKRIQLGTCILQVPLQNPTLLVRQVMTLQQYTGDRLVLGVGAGSTTTDFEAAGVAFDQRFRLLRENLAAFDSLYSEAESEQAPLPGWTGVTKPPVMIGSWAGGKWIERAAGQYDGWIASAAKTTKRTLQEGIERFRSLRGTRAMVTNVPVDLSAGESPFEDESPFTLNCSAPEAERRLAWLAELGYDDVVVTAPAWDVELFETLAQMVRNCGRGQSENQKG